MVDGTKKTPPRLCTLIVLCSLFLSVLPVFGQTGDDYENDDTYGAANVIVLGSVQAQEDTVQHHTLHTNEDTDWVVFYALAGFSYAIRTFNLESGVNTYIELYDTNGTTRLDYADFIGDPGHDDRLDWTCDKAGVYYVKIRSAPLGGTGGYDLVLFSTDIFYLPSYLNGTVKSTTGQPVSHARIQASGSEMTGTGLSRADGSFVLSLKSGTYTVFVEAAGYFSKIASSVSVPGNSQNIILTPINTPPVAQPDNLVVPWGGTGSGNVLANDTDANGDQLQAVLEKNVTHGSLTLNNNGSFTYKHSGDSSLSDSFTYHANDGFMDSNTVTVTIKIEETRKAIIAPVMLLLDGQSQPSM